jgi:hypothetical protein
VPVQTAFALQCGTPSFEFSTQVFSRLGVVEKGSWVDEPFEADNPKLDLFGSVAAAFTVQCTNVLTFSLDRSRAVSYQGGLNTLKLLLSDEVWQRIVPQGSHMLRGRAEAWDWWSLGFESSGLAFPLGSLQVSPNLVSLVSYDRKVFDGSVTRTGEVASLKASYERLGFDETGFSRNPGRTHSASGVGLSAAWTMEINDRERLFIRWENLWSYIPLKNAWWGRSNYELSNASVVNSTDTFARDNEIYGNYGQRTQDVRLPSILTAGLFSDSSLLAGIRLMAIQNQIHSVLDFKKSIGLGVLELSLVDTRMMLLGYQISSPGNFVNLSVGWVWSKYGLSSPLPLRLSIRF